MKRHLSWKTDFLQDTKMEENINEIKITSPGTLNCPKRNWKQYLCKILEEEQWVLGYFSKGLIGPSWWQHLWNRRCNWIKCTRRFEKVVHIPSGYIILNPSIYWTADDYISVLKMIMAKCNRGRVDEIGIIFSGVPLIHLSKVNPPPQSLSVPGLIL